MAKLEITIVTYDGKERNACALIDLPKDVIVPDTPLLSWIDLIKWIFANPELVAIFIQAIISIFSSKLPTTKTP